jgi:ATP-dependent Clp protease ATP-binding subunit ClpC
VSILDQILPAVAASDLIIIGEVSRTAATRLFQSRPSLRSLIEVLTLQPMDEEETLALAGEVGKRIVKHLGLVVSPQAVEATMELAQHYLGDGQLPGAALELLKRAARRSVQAGDKALTVDSVLDALSQLSGLPRIILDTSQKVELQEVREFFASRVIGQDEAVKSVVDRIAMLKAGLTDPGRPIGVFLFAGPTGTGKTELAKTLAEFLFGSPDRMTRLDMSEFQTQEATSKILGQRGESEADSLIDRIRKQPFSVVLLDEFEKAHPNCWDLFLQIFDDGRLSDANGREADFRHCFIILTSNLGATAHRSAGLGFRPSADAYGGEQVLRAIALTFRPEFVNRLDKTIVFRPLSRDLMRGILHKELARVLERRGLRERSWAVEWESSAIEFLLDRGFSPEMGARPLKRAIDQLLLAPLAATLVDHRFPEGDQFLFVRSNGKQIEVEFVDPDAEPAPSAAPEAEADSHLSLASIVLRQTGSATERASLGAFWREMSDEMAAPTWIAVGQELRLALSDPAIWASRSRAHRRTFVPALQNSGRVQRARIARVGGAAGLAIVQPAARPRRYRGRRADRCAASSRAGAGGGRRARPGGRLVRDPDRHVSPMGGQATHADRRDCGRRRQRRADPACHGIRGVQNIAGGGRTARARRSDAGQCAPHRSEGDRRRRAGAQPRGGGSARGSSPASGCGRVAFRHCAPVSRGPSSNGARCRCWMAQRPARCSVGRRFRPLQRHRAATAGRELGSG